jgi:hypothetical protein
MAVSGCGQTFPELTEEQYKQTVEYAAGLLMKYSNNGQERLVYVDAAELEKQRKRQEAKEAEETQQTQPAPPASQTAFTPVHDDIPDDTYLPEEEPADDPEDIMTGEDLTEETQEPAAQEPSEDTETADDAEPVAISDPGAITLSSELTQEITDDIFLSYQGYMVSSTYPESSKSYVVNADKGKKLLVLRFDLYNASDATRKVNMIPLNLLFQIVLNGKNLGYSSVTFLPNDLSSFSGDIESRAHESVVVLTQISEKESTSIQSLGMIVSLRGQNQSVNLK